jgi:hypothetical protein
VRTVLLIAVLTLAACDRPGTPGIQVDAKLKPYILPRSQFLAGVELDKIRETAFFKRHQAQLDLPQLNQLPQEIGMDPRRDLSSFMMSWNGTSTLFMTRGTYSSDLLEKRLSGLAKTETYGPFKLYGDGQRDVVFLPKGIALIASAPLLKTAVKQQDGAIPEDLQMQLSRLPKSAQVWEASSGIISPEQLAVRSDTASLLSNISGYINGTALGITLSEGLAVDARISCVSEEGSTRVHDALRGLIGLARLSTKDNELDQLKIWDSIKVDKQAKEVHVTAELPAALADKAIDILRASTSRLR